MCDTRQIISYELNTWVSIRARSSHIHDFIYLLVFGCLFKIILCYNLSWHNNQKTTLQGLYFPSYYLPTSFREIRTGPDCNEPFMIHDDVYRLPTGKHKISVRVSLSRVLPHSLLWLVVEWYQSWRLSTPIYIRTICIQRANRLLRCDAKMVIAQALDSSRLFEQYRSTLISKFRRIRWMRRFSSISFAW